jgi:hypothetical protein
MATHAISGDLLMQRMNDALKDIPEGRVATIDYSYPRPGTIEPVPKQSFITRVGNEGCGVGFYK